MRLVVELLIDGKRTFANWMEVELADLEEHGRCWVDCPTPDGRTARAQLLMDPSEGL